MALKLCYFAVLRERMGMSEESIAFHADHTNGDALISWLNTRDENAQALNHPSVRLIINDEIASRSTTLKDGDTIAFCPPFSGG